MAKSTLPGWQKKLIDRRRAQYRKDPCNVIPGEVFKAMLRAGADRFRRASRSA